MNSPENQDTNSVLRNTAGAKGIISILGLFRTVVLIATSLILLCDCSRPTQEDDYLIHVGSSTVTVSEFKLAVQAAAEEAFPGEQEVNAATKNDLRTRVLNQLIEEMIISERAKAMGLSVSDEDLERAVAGIKADYPDDTFEKALLENAVSFQSWKKKLAMRLLIDKVIESELVDKAEINSQDLAEYFQDHYPEGVPEGENADAINQKIVRHLRRQKAEGMYQAWIDNLRKSYPVEIDQKRWNRLSGSKSW